ncbi:MAG: beta-mannanase [Armatimonadota bacterium]|nr:beta-mannanase [Armatimonadota bacterium]
MKRSLISPLAIAALPLCLLLTTAIGYSAPDVPAPEAPAAAETKATEATDFPATGAPYIAAYRWGAANKNGGAKANEAFATWLNRPVVWAEDFEPIERWDNNIEGGSWQLGEWSAWKKAVPGRRLILSVPLLPGGWDRSGPKSGEGAGQKVSLEAGAKGEYNEHFKDLAQNLVQYNLADSILRLGWEFNGGWYTWRASDNPKAWAEYWQQIVKAMRAVPGAEKLKFCWNPALGWLQFPADQAWPGDEYVDFVGLDVYDDSWQSNTYPWPADATPEDIEARRHKVWNDVLLNGQHGLMVYKNFAAKHNKPFSIPEWGVSKRQDTHGGLDNPYFIEQMHKFITDPANNVYFHCYFDVQAGDGHHQLSPGLSGTEATEFPLSAAKFKELFGLAP